jgi:hypothetical protein
MKSFRECNPPEQRGVLVAEERPSGQLFIVVDKVSRERLAEWWVARMGRRSVRVL